MRLFSVRRKRNADPGPDFKPKPVGKPSFDLSTFLLVAFLLVALLSLTLFLLIVFNIAG